MRGQTCKMMLAMVLLVASRAAGGRDGPSTSAGADLIDLPSFGVALALPVGWWRGPEEREQDVFTCVRRDRTGTITGRIGMYFEPATAAADVNDLIRKRAARRDGTVREKPVKLGGLDAAEMTAAQSKGAQRLGIVIMRSAKFDGRYYTLYQAIPNANDRADFDALASSIRFTAPAPPFKSLANRADPVLMLDGAVAMSLPDPFRFCERKTADDGKTYVIYRSRNLKDLAVEVEIMTSTVRGGSHDPQDIEGLSKMLAERLELDEPPQWTYLERGRVHMASSTVFTPRAGTDDKDAASPRSPLQMLIITLNGDAVSVTFEYRTGDEAARSRYREAVKRIVESIREVPGSR